MALYQASVLNKYLKQLDKAAVDKAYKAYTKYFLHPTIQENIRNSKEEQFQEGFLRELFVKILGYTLNPTPNFNLTTELKNEKGAKKADGAVLRADGKAIAVIELKGMDTVDLDKIRVQAFDYKANHTECVYVVTSNFEKLRFYIHNAVEHEEFNLFMLSHERFTLLYLCLHKDNIQNGIPERIKTDSVVAEESITKKFYADYSVFKRELFRDLVKLNLKNEVFRSELTQEDADRGIKNIKLTLFQKSQKLIDRFLFIFFAEDRGLLPPNSITLIINEYKQLAEMDRAEPLYDTYKLYFRYLDQGRAGTDKKAEIFAYNGGLFKPDAVLESLLISDALLLKHTSTLTAYDFESQVDVNILGHIFENSLNEIESVNAEIEGTDFDKQKTKRKKDGVFYTPKYITKYIVDNTVGKLCTEKKLALKLEDEEYHKGRKNRQKKTLEDLLTKLEEYREWLLNLTVCDPACGSGAFLNQALDYLIREHTYVDELKTALLGGALVLSDVENTILERNIYGVDLNEESVEIAKLSLWLRTAQPRRKLNSLNNNIKCGNSLIDSKAVAGEKAFHWETEFPEVFAAGGFDVVIGNPPYVRSRELFSEKEKEYYLKRFTTTSYQLDLYKLFIEKCCGLISVNGLMSFITPSVFLTNDYDKPLRKFIIENFSLKIVASSDKDVFDDASVKTVTFVISNYKADNKVSFFKIHKAEFHFEKKIKQIAFIAQDYLINEKLNTEAIPIINKLNRFRKLGKFFDVKNGIKVRKDLLSPIKLDNSHKKFILGKNIFSYYNTYDGLFIDYKPKNEKLFTNQAFRNAEIFEQEKLITRQILGKRIVTCFDNQNYYSDQTTYVINKLVEGQELKFLMCVLNSKLIYFYFINTSSDNKITFPKVKRSQLLELPYNEMAKQEGFIQKSTHYQTTINLLNNGTKSFLTYLLSKFPIERPSKKLQKWYELEFGEFTTELAKAAKKGAKEQGIDYTPMTKTQEFDYMELFTTKKAEAQALKSEIDKTDKEIDAMVYELYGLSEEEIGIVEQS